VPGTVTLTTDFGTSDPYVGALRGALLATVPRLQLVDLSHDIAPQDILAGAFVLRHAAFEFPTDTVHLAVVDPGVGSTRRPLAIEAAGYRWVGPDNGLLSFALECPDARAFEITHPDLRRESVSATFHGRDVFAPAAAKLAAGFPIRSVGPSIDDALFLEATQTVASDAGLVGTIVHVDHFGNLISCICTSALAALGDPAHLRVSAGGDPAAIAVTGIVHTYADVQVGSTAALIGSSDLLELVVRDGNAANRFGLRRGDTITVERYP
jgi:S-adenosyl-L-methionine hydrolase (adenosine-forming)